MPRGRDEGARGAVAAPRGPARHGGAPPPRPARRAEAAYPRDLARRQGDGRGEGHVLVRPERADLDDGHGHLVRPPRGRGGDGPALLGHDPARSRALRHGRGPEGEPDPAGRDLHGPEPDRGRVPAGRQHRRGDGPEGRDRRLDGHEPPRHDPVRVAQALLRAGHDRRGRGQEHEGPAQARRGAPAGGEGGPDPERHDQRGDRRAPDRRHGRAPPRDHHGPDQARQGRGDRHLAADRGLPRDADGEGGERRGQVAEPAQPVLRGPRAPARQHRRDDQERRGLDEPAHARAA